LSKKAFDSPSSTKRKDPLPFMSQLTSNTNDSCVTLRDGSDEENEEDKDEGRDKAKEEGLETGFWKNIWIEERYSIAVALISHSKSKMKCETNVIMYK